MNNGWYVMLSDLKDGDLEMIERKIGMSAAPFDYDDCGFGYNGYGYWFGFLAEAEREKQGRRLTREKAMKKMGIDV